MLHCSLYLFFVLAVAVHLAGRTSVINKLEARNQHAHSNPFLLRLGVWGGVGVLSGFSNSDMGCVFELFWTGLPLATRALTFAA